MSLEYASLNNIWTEHGGDQPTEPTWQFRFYLDDQGSPGTELDEMRVQPSIGVNGSDIVGGMKMTPDAQFDSDPYDDAAGNVQTATADVVWTKLLADIGGTFYSVAWANEGSPVTVANGQRVTVTPNTEFKLGGVGTFNDDYPANALDYWCSIIHDELSDGTGYYTHLRWELEIDQPSGTLTKTYDYSLPLNSPGEVQWVGNGGTSGKVTITRDFKLTTSSGDSTEDEEAVVAVRLLLGDGASTWHYLSEDTSWTENVTIPGFVKIENWDIDP